MQATNEGVQLPPFQGHKASVNCITVDERRGLLLSGAGDKCVREWNMQSGSSRKICADLHTNTIRCRAQLTVDPLTRGVPSALW